MVVVLWAVDCFLFMFIMVSTWLCCCIWNFSRFGGLLQFIFLVCFELSVWPDLFA